MGWREAAAVALADAKNISDDGKTRTDVYYPPNPRHALWVERGLFAMPPADRIALARELLTPGFVVAPTNPAPLRDGEMLIRVEMRAGGRICEYNRIVPIVMNMNAPDKAVGYEATDVAIRVLNACRAAMLEDD